MKTALIFALLFLGLFACKKKEITTNSTVSTDKIADNKIQISRFGDIYYTYDSKGNLVGTTSISGGISTDLAGWNYLSTNYIMSGSTFGPSYDSLNLKGYLSCFNYDENGIANYVAIGTKKYASKIFNTVLNGDVIKLKEDYTQFHEPINLDQSFYKKIMYTNIVNKGKLPIIETKGIGFVLNPYIYGNAVKHLPEKVVCTDANFNGVSSTIQYSYEFNSDSLVTKITKIWFGDISDTIVVPVEYVK